MKKRTLWLLLAGLALLFAVAGCNEKKSVAASTTLKEPPDLQLQYTVDGQEAETVVPSGNYEWYYDNGDGTRTGGIASGPHPLDLSKATPVITQDAGLTQLEVVFSLIPDSYSVRCWPDSCLGNAQKYENDASALAVSGNVINLPANGRGYIYELNAEWADGSASYSFYVIPPA